MTDIITAGGSEHNISRVIHEVSRYAVLPCLSKNLVLFYGVMSNSMSVCSSLVSYQFKRIEESLAAVMCSMYFSNIEVGGRY